MGGAESVEADASAPDQTDGQTILTFYGEDWCPDCVQSKKFLDKHKVQYEVIKGRPPKEKFGTTKIPTIVFPDGTWLTEPNDEDLQEKCEANGLIERQLNGEEGKTEGTKKQQEVSPKRKRTGPLKVHVTYCGG